jgi:hypothetical protein
MMYGVFYSIIIFKRTYQLRILTASSARPAHQRVPRARKARAPTTFPTAPPTRPQAPHASALTLPRVQIG